MGVRDIRNVRQSRHSRLALGELQSRDTTLPIRLLVLRLSQGISSPLQLLSYLGWSGSFEVHLGLDGADVSRGVIFVQRLDIAHIVEVNLTFVVLLIIQTVA